MQSASLALAATISLACTLGQAATCPKQPRPSTPQPAPRLRAEARDRPLVMSAAEAREAEPEQSPPALTFNEQADAPRSLAVGGAPVLLDEMGPIVVGADGSLSRIANWESMSEREREVARRRIVTRNQRRLAELRAEQPEAGGGAAEEASRGPPRALPPAASDRGDGDQRPTRPE